MAVRHHGGIIWLWKNNNKVERGLTWSSAGNNPALRWRLNSTTSRHPFQPAFLEVYQLRLKYISGRIKAILLRDDCSEPIQLKMNLCFQSPFRVQKRQKKFYLIQWKNKVVWQSCVSYSCFYPEQVCRLCVRNSLHGFAGPKVWKGVYLNKSSFPSPKSCCESKARFRISSPMDVCICSPYTGYGP